MGYLWVHLEVQQGRLPGDKAVYIRAVQSDGRLSSECRTLIEFDSCVKDLNRELKSLRQQAAKFLKRDEPTPHI